MAYPLSELLISREDNFLMVEEEYEIQKPTLYNDENPAPDPGTNDLVVEAIYNSQGIEFKKRVDIHNLIHLPCSYKDFSCRLIPIANKDSFFNNILRDGADVGRYKKNAISLKNWLFKLIDPLTGQAVYNMLPFLNRLRMLCASIVKNPNYPYSEKLKKDYQTLIDCANNGRIIKYEGKNITKRVKDAIYNPPLSYHKSSSFFCAKFWLKVYSLKYSVAKRLFECEIPNILYNPFLSNISTCENRNIVAMSVRINNENVINDNSKHVSRYFSKLVLANSLRNAKESIKDEFTTKRGVEGAFFKYLRIITNFHAFITEWLLKIFIEKDLPICLQYDASRLDGRESIIIMLDVPNFGEHNVPPPEHEIFNEKTEVFISNTMTIDVIRYLDWLKNKNLVVLCQKINGVRSYGEPPFHRTSVTGKTAYDLGIWLLDFLVDRGILKTYSLPTFLFHGKSPIMVENTISTFPEKVTYKLDAKREIELTFASSYIEENVRIIIGTDGGNPEIMLCEMLSRHHEQFMHSPCFAHISHNLITKSMTFNLVLEDAERCWSNLLNVMNWKELGEMITNGQKSLLAEFRLILNYFNGGASVPSIDSNYFKKVKSICLLKTFRNAGISIEKNPINRWNNKVDCEVIEPSDAELKSNPMICEDFLMGYENRKLQVLKELGQDRKYMGLRVNDKIRNEAGVEIEDSDRLKEMYDRYKKFSYIHCNIPIITMASIIQKEHVELKFFAYVQSLINVELWKIFLENDDNKLDNVRWQATEDFFRVFTMCFRPDELKEEFKLGEDLLGM
ncbi:hypothetical protein PCE1_003008 [Barthelona sp. PCE]